MSNSFATPDARFSPTPFWFWNDDLEPERLLAQVAEFQARGIEAFVIHPRIGLNRRFGFLSRELLDLMRLVIEEAARRGIRVVLYDEAMYPSGSAGGRVVAENPAHACRGLILQDAPPDDPDHHVLYAGPTRSGRPVWIVDRPLKSAIRGVHFLDGFGDERTPGSDWMSRRAPEEHPPATDLLNPEAVASFIRIVYQRFHDEFGEHFGKTIPAIFTDEPYVMGRFSPLKNPRPGTTDILEHVNAFLNYDFTPHLPTLWLDNEPNAIHHRENYRRAIQHRLGQTYYQQLGEWCAGHGVALTGHPEGNEDLGHLRHFQWPGQDVILGDIRQGEPAVTGVPSVQAKCAASVAIHLGRDRNANEFMGAYGENTSFDLYRFVARWLVVRGCNLLVPHAFFYSVRGARIDDCPPDLGPHSPWWNDSALIGFHREMRRLCWVNHASLPRCRVAVLGSADRLPIKAARLLFERQIDFHYVEDRHLWTNAVIDADCIRVGPMTYDLLVAEEAWIHPRVESALGAFAESGRLMILEREPDPTGRMSERAAPVVATAKPEPWLRARLVDKDGAAWLMLFNEGEVTISPTVIFPEGVDWQELDPTTGEVVKDTKIPLVLTSGELRLFSGRAATPLAAVSFQ